MTTYSTGMKMMERTVEATMPPATVVPMELRPAAPAPVARARGSTPRMKAQRSHENGPQADARRLHRGVHDGEAAFAQLLGELHDQDGVLGREADEQDQAHLAEDIVGEAADELRGQGAEDREGHAQQNDEGQDERLVLRGQDQVDEEHAQREDQARLRTRLDLLEGLAGPRVGEARGELLREILHGGEGLARAQPLARGCP